MDGRSKAPGTVIIVGAGITGCAIAYHLARLGHTDVTVLDRGTLGAPLGSTGHAPGLLGRNSASPVMAALADYTADLLARLPGAVFNKVGSIEVARKTETADLLERKAATARGYGFDAHLVGPGELAGLVPYMDASGLKRGLYLPDDGTLDARAALRGLHEGARDAGVTFRETVAVRDLLVREGRVVGVVTDEGEIVGDRIVIAVGIWGAELLKRHGIALPLLPVQHPYFTTAPMAVLDGGSAPSRHPMVRDLENLFYLREHGDRLGFGWYNHAPAPAEVAGLIEAEMAFPARGFHEVLSHDLFPVLAGAPIERKLNGIFSMTPDGGPLLGPVPGEPHLWVAEAVWVTHSGGVGRAVAEALLGLEPSIDVSAFAQDRFAAMPEDVRRARSLSLYNDIYAWPAR